MKSFARWSLFVMCVVCCACLSGCPSNQSNAPPGPQKFALATPGQVGPFVIPPSWQQAAWFVDPSNTSTCASDNNRTCSLGTCGTSGDGPCLSYGSIASRWGTYMPRIQQNTSVTAMSSDTADSDVWYVGPFSLEQGASFIVQGTLTTVQSTTLSAVTAKNRSTPQLLQVTFTASTGITAGMLVTNTTHSSRAWTYKLVSGSTWLMTQPGAVISETTPKLLNCQNPAEVNTWALGDSVTVSSTPQVNLSNASALVEGESSSTFANGLVIYNVGVRTLTSSSAFGPMVLGGWTEFQESMSTIPVYPEVSGSLGGLGNGFINSALQGGVLANFGSSLSTTAYGTGLSSPITCFAAGYFGTGTTYNVTPTLGVFTQDTIFAAGNSSLNNIFLGQVQSVYLDGGTLTTNGQMNVSASGTPAIGPFVWGTGTLGIVGKGIVTYPVGAGNAAATFLQTGGLTFNSQTKTCLGVPSVATPTLTCNITGTPANADTNLGATAGCLWVEGGSSLCNFTN
jgi:hypothetical protein